MKKSVLVGGIALLLALAMGLTGCGKDKVVGNFGESGKSLYLYKDLAIQDVLVEDFNEEELVLDEYKGFLEAEVSEYNKNADFIAPTGERSEKEPAFTEPVTIVKCEVKKNKLNQQLIYANVKDYCAYNEEYLKEVGGTYVKCGTLADPESVILDTVFYDAKGETVDVSKWCRDSKAANYRYIIADYDCILYGDGNLVAYARGMKYEKSKGCAATGEAKISIIILK